jgi:O-antigen ligase
MMLRDGNIGSARIASWLLFAAAVFAPLPFGSVLPPVVAFWCVVLGVCLVLAPVPSLTGGQLALVGLAAIVIAAYALALHEQLAEHPWFAFAAPHPIWREAQAALHTPIVPIISIARNVPWLALGRPLLCALAMICGFLIGADQGRARRLIKLIAWSGAAYAAYAIFARVFDPTHILWQEKRAYLDSVTGTFINRNTAAAYFGSCAIVWSLLFCETLRRDAAAGSLDWSAFAAHMISSPSKKSVVALAMFFLCLAAMFMTGSRAGAILSLFALAIAFLGFFWRDLPRRAGYIGGFLGCVAVALILLQFLGGDVDARFDFAGLSDGGRLETYKSTLRMIAEHPWFGTGQGTFAYAFPAYRSSSISIWGVWDMAHNTPLEIAADMGVPVATLVIVGWIAIFAVLVRGTVIRRRGVLVPAAALAIAILATLHSLIDFTLQIPGYSIVALSLIGAGLAQSFRGNGARGVQKRGREMEACSPPEELDAPSAS